MRALAALALASCAATPALTYVVEGNDPADAGGDASLAHPSDAGADAATSDGATPIDQTPVDDGDDAGPDANVMIACGSGTVGGCAACPGAPLRCTVGTRDECVSDCEACSPGWGACFHCPPNGKVRGRCIPHNANGKLACSNANRCSCADAGDCPRSASGAETCIGEACFACGEPGTAQSACVRGDGSTGTCRSDGTTLTCR